jgi:hypothetical protein
MLDLLGLTVVVLAPSLLIVTLLLLSTLVQRARADLTERQVAVTDAIDAELGHVLLPRG